MSYPSLAALSLHPHPRKDLLPDAPTGKYCLDMVEEVKPCDSSVIIIRNALNASHADVQKLDDFMSDEARVATTPNTQGGFEKNDDGSFVAPNASTPSWRIHRDPNSGAPSGKLYKTSVGRKQATFGAVYNFGQANTIIQDRTQWPQLVTQCLEYAQQLAEQKGLARELYNGVHVNLYSSGKTGLMAHSDKEPAMVEGLPIFSFTVLNGDLLPRPFSIYHPPASPGAKPQKVADVMLGNGDLLIMQGSMQKWFLHGVEKTSAKRFAAARRLNLTVRAFKPPEKRKAESDK